MQILVIDDDHDMLDNVSTILELAGYEVLRADNGIAGLRLLHDYHPALILCDIMMPELNGYEVLEEIQSNSKTALIPVVFLTAKSDLHDVRRGMQAGADDYLAKPFTEQDLLMAIQKRLEKRHRWELQQRITFAHHLVQTQEQEAQRIARELDQGFRQKLLNIKFFLDAQMLTPHSDGLLTQMQRSLDELLGQITTLSYSLYPVMLSHLGLTPTLQWYFNTVQQRLNIKIMFDVYNMETRLVEATELILYRIVQRVMENITTATQDMRAVLWRDENTVRLSISPLPTLDQTQRWQLLQRLEGYAQTIDANVVLQEDEARSIAVYVTLPNAIFQESEASAPMPMLQTVPPSDTVLLAVSPDSLFLQQVTQMLQSLVRVVTLKTDDPDSLMSQIRTRAPHLLVLDLLIPANMMTTLSREAAVIVLSPYSDETFARQTLRQGVMGFIPKAKARTELVSAVQAVMQREQYISASLVLGSEPPQNTKSLNLDALLTRREREIMELILQDKTHADIASELVISPRTVEKHRANMMQKLALNTHTELILFALRYGLMSSQ